MASSNKNSVYLLFGVLAAIAVMGGVYYALSIEATGVVDEVMYRAYE